MQIYEGLKHTTWECKYHVVFIPKYRRKSLYVSLRREMGAVFRDLARQRESEVLKGHLMPDHVHMLLSVPPKYSVAQVMGFIKGKSAIHIARVYALLSLRVNLRTLLNKLFRLVLHPFHQRRVFAHALLSSEFPNVFRDLHRAEVRAAHAAE